MITAPTLNRKKGGLGHSATPSLAFAGAVAAGDTLCCALFQHGSSDNLVDVAGVADNVNGAWALADAGKYETGQDNGVVLYYFENSAAGTPTVTVTAVGGHFLDGEMMIFRIPGVKSSGSLDQHKGATGGSGAPNPGTITPTEDNEIIIFAEAANVGTTFTPTGGFTVLDSFTAVEGTNGCVGYLIQTSATAATAYLTAPTGNWAATGASFRVAASAVQGSRVRSNLVGGSGRVTSQRAGGSA